MANFLAPMITLILTIFAVVFYTGQIWVNGFIGCFGHANIQMAIAMCFLTGSIAAGIVGIKSKLITLGGAIDKWTKGAASMMQVIMILVCAWSISGLTKSMNIGQFLTGVVQDSIPAALIPAILFLIGVVVSFATGSSSLPRMTFCTLSSCLCSGSVIPMLMETESPSPPGDFSPVSLSRPPTV